MLKYNKIIALLLLVTIFILLVACGEKTYLIDQTTNTGVTEQTSLDYRTDEIDPISPEEFIIRFQENEYAFIYEHMTEEYRSSISLDDLVELSEPFNQGVKEYYLEATMPFGGKYKYTWLDDQRSKSVSIYVDADNQIAGFWIYPITTYPDTDQTYSSIEYSLPFQGEWFTYWGGTNEIVNYHYAFAEQRYAYDFVIMKDDYTYHDDIESNESYYAFGEFVYAPADGIVVAIENGIEDNEPGLMDPYHPEGNYIVIDHGNGEYSLLSHLEYNSIEVSVGDYIIRGDRLARCGNSGNSSEPHIHFQVMDSHDLRDATSINPRFTGYDRIVQGDFVIGN